MGYRYFAGDPEYILAGVDATIESCSSILQRNSSCDIDIPLLGASTNGVETVVHLNDNWEPELFAIGVPENLQSLQIGKRKFETSHIMSARTTPIY